MLLPASIAPMSWEGVAPTVMEEGRAEVDEQARRLLRGAIDLHLHTAPDVFPRSVDTYEAAVQARDAGMRAIVVKSHNGDTAARAALVSKLTGFDVFGGVALNYGVGGFNWHAVRDSHWHGGREVWMPTTSARAFFERGLSVPQLYERVPVGREPGLVATDGGRLLPAVDEIVRLVAETGMILSTGHLDPVEGLVLLEVAREVGVERLVVTHPHADFVGYTVEQMRAAAALGAVHEIHAAFTTHAVGHGATVEELAALVRQVGVSHCILATDGGQKSNPPPVEMLRSFIAGFLACGFDEDEIRLMTAVTPARLLGLDA